MAPDGKSYTFQTHVTASTGQTHVTATTGNYEETAVFVKE
jgi:hypothetical protein